MRPESEDVAQSQGRVGATAGIACETCPGEMCRSWSANR